MTDQTDTTPAEWIATGRALADAATPGPWVSQNATLWEQADPDPADWWVWQESRLPFFGGVIHVEDHDVDKPGAIGCTEITDGRRPAEEGADAAFISASRTRLPQALDALDAVLALHQGVDYDEGDFWCEHCGPAAHWPCPTVGAVTAALAGEPS